MITKITENLYIGDHDDVVNHSADELAQILLSLQVTAIVNLMETEDEREVALIKEAVKQGARVRYFWSPIMTGEQDMYLEFVRAYKKLRALLSKNETVLIHCLASVDRAPLVTALYLSKKLCIPVQDAYLIVKKKRMIIEHYEWLAEIRKRGFRF
jgi:protein-tyrosine phosphatase